jgi:hypothetical protein
VNWLLCTMNSDGEPDCIVWVLKLRDDDFFSLCGTKTESGNLIFGRPTCLACIAEWQLRQAPA